MVTDLAEALLKRSRDGQAGNSRPGQGSSGKIVARSGLTGQHALLDWSACCGPVLQERMVVVGCSQETGTEEARWAVVQGKRPSQDRVGEHSSRSATQGQLATQG